MHKYLLAALLAGSVATPAFGQEAGPFSGFRVEGVVGYDRLGSSEEDEDDNENVNGVAYGFGAGFDFDLGSMVAGIEAEYTESTGDKTVVEGGETTRLKTGDDLYVGGRLGFRAGPSTLVYGKLGFTTLSFKGRISDATEALEFKADGEGFRLGAGVEQLFGPNAYGKLEYRYSDYGKLKLEAAGVDLGNEDLGINRHQVVAGIGFRF